MSVGDIEKLKLGEELVCIEDYNGYDYNGYGYTKLQTGEVYYFITFHKENNVLYLSKQPINSNANPSSIYSTDVAKYLERRSELRRQKINNILQ